MLKWDAIQILKMRDGFTLFAFSQFYCCAIRMHRFYPLIWQLNRTFQKQTTSDNLYIVLSVWSVVTVQSSHLIDPNKKVKRKMEKLSSSHLRIQCETDGWLLVTGIWELRMVQQKWRETEEKKQKQKNESKTNHHNFHTIFPPADNNPSKFFQNNSICAGMSWLKAKISSKLTLSVVYCISRFNGKSSHLLSLAHSS